MTTYCWGITARKFCRMCLWSPALHCRHICSSRYDCRSSLLIPRRIFCPSFRLFQQDSISWVWNPVNASTKLRAWTTIRWLATLLIRAAIPLYAAQSSVYNTVPGRMHLVMMGSRVAILRLSTTWKWPLAGVNSVVIIPKTHVSLAALLPLLY